MSRLPPRHITTGTSKLVTSNEKTLNFKLVPELYEELVKLAQKRNSSPTSIAKEVIVDFCKRKKGN